jgi:hypothetical protein
MTMRKFGRFELTQDFVRTLHEGEGTNLFYGMFVMRAHENFATNTIDYVGIHKDFDYCPIGQLIPKYHAIIEAGEIYPKWVRV